MGFLRIPHVPLGQCYVLGYDVIEGTDEIYRRYISVNYGTITNRYNKLIILILTFTHCTITSIYRSGSAMALFHQFIRPTMAEAIAVTAI